MSVQPPQDIKELLLRQDVQERIHKSMETARSGASVTISRAAELFQFSESQLREWEKKGLVTTKREALSQEGRGHRQYSPAELDKLAIIKTLLEEGYAPGSIPANVDEIWQQVARTPEPRLSTRPLKASSRTRVPIDQRVVYAEKEVFWRYFTSQALRLSLLLICEDTPDTVAGLVLPLQKSAVTTTVREPQDLVKISQALIGWLDFNRSFYAFLASAPFFEAPSDFRLERLLNPQRESRTNSHVEQDETVVVLQRKVRTLELSAATVQAIRRLLAPIYMFGESWLPAFDYGMRDWLYQATDFTSSVNSPDVVLNEMMEMVVRLGGETPAGSDRWRFACLLLPEDPALPLQQHSLVVQAQSRQSPYKVGISTADPEHAGLSLRAYQSGFVIYRPTSSSNDFMIAYQELERYPRSAIALPVAGADGISIAVFYIAADEEDAFSAEDQRVLRLLGKMIQELLLTYNARQQDAGKLSELIGAPGIVDISFKEFLSESAFIRDLETLLLSIDAQDRSDFAPEEEASFLAIDIDNLSALATKYGERVARNLCIEVGSRILKHLALFENFNHRRLYHVSADRYYLLLDGMSLAEARENAYKLKIDLTDDYQVDAKSISSVRRPALPGALLELPGVTVRLGVSSYKYGKLKEVLQRPYPNSVARVEELIADSLETVLSLGQAKGGDVIVSWDPDLRGYRTWSPLK